MKKIAVIASSVILLTLMGWGVGISDIQPPAEAAVQTSDITAENLIALMNKDREVAGLAPLRRNSKLSESALHKADDMVAKEYFAHDSPSGLQPWYFFYEAGYFYSKAAENLGLTYIGDSEWDSVRMEEAWMNSPTHQKNILNPAYDEVGVAIEEGIYQGAPILFAVVHFGTI